MSTESILSIISIVTSLLGVIITAFVTYNIAKDRLVSEFSKLQLQAENERKQQDRIYLINLKIEESKNIIYSLDVLLNIQFSILLLYRESKDDTSEKVQNEIKKAFSDLTVTINYFPELKKQFVKLEATYTKMSFDILLKKHKKEEIPIELAQEESLELVLEVVDMKKTVGDRIEELILELEKNF